MPKNITKSLETESDLRESRDATKMVKMNSAFDELKDIDRQLHANKKKRVESPNY